MADKYPSPSSMGKDRAMTQDEYDARRSWLIDTAETSEDKKKLAKDLAALDAMYKKQQKQGTQKGHSVISIDRKTGKAK